MNQHKVSFFLYFVAFLCGVFALLFFDSIRMIVNVVIGLCGARNSSIVGVNWLCVVLGVCVCVRHVSVLPKKSVHTVWYWTVVNRMFRLATTENEKLTDWVLGVTFEMAFATVNTDFIEIWTVCCCCSDRISFSTQTIHTRTFLAHLNHWCLHYSQLNRLSQCSWFI